MTAVRLYRSVSATLCACLALCAATLCPAALAAQNVKPSSAPSDSATSCNYNSFQRVANGQTFWASTGQQTQGPTVGQMNCLLDQFAMNNFLYLVGNDSTGKPRFMSYAPWETLFTSTGTPSWPGKFLPLSTTALHRFKNKEQAGDGYLLQDINSQTTSYDIRVNQTFFNYVATNSLYTQTAFNAAQTAFNNNSATGGIYFPPTSQSDTNVGAIELKTSWRYYGPMQKKYISQRVVIKINPCPETLMHCEMDTKGNYWGLVGFHLVQKTVDQPGFVWATFEHVGNAPDCSPGSSTPISKNPVSPMTGKPINLNSQLLNGVGVQTGWNYFNYTTYLDAKGDGKQCIYPTNQQTGTQCLSSPVGADNTWIPVNVCRTLALPKATAATCTGSITDGNNMKASACLNDSVMQNFDSTKLAAKWANYRLVGMEWLTSGATGFGQFTAACLTYDETGPAACPNYNPSGGASSPGTRVGEGGGPPNFGRVGSGANTVVNPANTTMETWMQYNVNLNSAASQTDCFGCHQPPTASGSGGFAQGDFSHLFERIRQK